MESTPDVRTKKEVLHDDDDDDDSWRCNVPSQFVLLTAPFPDLQNFLCFRCLHLAQTGRTLALALPVLEATNNSGTEQSR